MSLASNGVVLIVDDEPLKCTTLRIELTEAGYTVLEAFNAAEALRHLHAQPVNVVVTDLRMPEMDGLQLLERVKSAAPSTHVILMTAFASVDTAVEAMKLGACDYLVKPFKTELLLEKLNGLRSSQDKLLKHGNGKIGDPFDGQKWQTGTVADDNSSRMEGWPLPENVAGLTEAIAGIERSLIDAALRRAAGNQAKAAQFLGIPRTTLRDKMTKYGMVGETGKRKITS
jgi:two-component system, NtrC family, response regulator AtoC